MMLIQVKLQVFKFKKPSFARLNLDSGVKGELSPDSILSLAKLPLRV